MKENRKKTERKQNSWWAVASIAPYFGHILWQKKIWKKKKKEDCFDIVISKVWQALEKNKIGNGFVFWIMNEITGSVCLILLRTKKTD